MSLSTALNIAQSSLLTASRQTGLVSRNLAESQNPDYARRSAVVSSTAPGARSVQVQRATDDLLFRQNLSAQSSWSGQSTLYDGMERLGLSVNGIDNAASPSTAIGRLQEALQLYSTSPSNNTLAEGAVDAARQVVRSLNDGTQAIQNFRVDIDGQIASAAGELNNLLSSFTQVNKAITSGSRSGRDISDQLDQRDAILKKIADYVPISTFERAGGDTVIMTRDGTTLFETVPRAVTFEPSPGYSAGIAGNTIRIDGVPIGSEGAGGKLAGLVQLRDSVAVTMQSQLDEVARGLIVAFAETDPSGALADAPGLFTWPGAPGMPAPGVLADGLAGRMRINAAFDSGAGGDPRLLRDGGANGAGYIANSGGAASYSQLLLSYGDRLDRPMAFAPAAGITTVSSVVSYSSNAIGWFEGVRKEAYTAAENSQALSVRTAQALSNATGVNVDMEMSLLLDLEHSYEASARLIKAVDEMMAALLSAVR